MSRAYLAFAATLFAAALALAPSLYVSRASAGYIFSDAALAPTSTVALVLGASVYQSGELSPVLKARADRAAALYRAGRVEKILVSGDNGALSHNEVNPTGNYLVNLGIPKEDIFLDHAGFDTYSSMYRAKAVFGVTRMLVVSQAFHLPRAVYLARALGIDAYGVEAAGEWSAYNAAREVPADAKALFDVVARRVPHYLGEAYSVEGDGSATWADEEPLH